MVYIEYKNCIGTLVGYNRTIFAATGISIFLKKYAVSLQFQ